jgi:2-oxoglutarate ferredoxin oxidoreductase subunit alpha
MKPPEMKSTTTQETPVDEGSKPARMKLDEQIVEIVSDSGEGAQKAGQSFGSISARMGNGVWTVEIIPAEIKPPARSRAGASGIRVRFGSHYVTNMGDEADLVVAFNEQVLYGRIEQGAYRPGTVILLESKWAEDPIEEVRLQYKQAIEEFQKQGLIVHEIPIEKAFTEAAPEARVGKNMFVLGMLCHIYDRTLQTALDEVKYIFARKSEKVIALNQDLVRAGYAYARDHLDFAYEVPPWPHTEPQVVMNGNQAVGLGVMAAGMEVVAMYPITPATSASHYLAGVYHKAGGCLHQAEDEIAAVGFAIGSSYAGKTAATITSGPGFALKTEFVGLAAMAEIPMVIVVVQRGGPSTGLPTKVEQGELLASLHACPGDAPKIVLAASTIEECFQFMILGRRLAEAFRTPVVVLTDANLATGVQPFPRPAITAENLAPPIEQRPWPDGKPPYDWDEETGLSTRPIPGQRGGEYVLTGLAHTRWSKVAYDPFSNQKGCDMRSRKLAALQSTLVPPTVHGDPEGDLLVVGWGSTLGSIEEAVDRLRTEGHKISSVHLRFFSPLEPGLREIFTKFRKVMTVEINYSDAKGSPFTNTENRRRSQLARILRERTLIDVDCWSIIPGAPLPPGRIESMLREELKAVEGDNICSA